MGLRHHTAIVAIALTPMSAPAATIVLSDILSIDALGYECVAGQYFEETEDQAAIAFTISEKIRLPRTCLPNPCDRALTRRELSNLTGTETTLAKFEDEWDEYYARYADHCRKEVVDPSVKPTRDEEFWPPITNPEPPTYVPPSDPPPPPPPPTPPPGLPPTFTSPEPPTEPPEDPPVVPLPNSLILSLSALALFVRRRRG